MTDASINPRQKQCACLQPPTFSCNPSLMKYFWRKEARWMDLWGKGYFQNYKKKEKKKKKWIYQCVKESVMREGIFRKCLDSLLYISCKNLHPLHSHKYIMNHLMEVRWRSCLQPCADSMTLQQGFWFLATFDWWQTYFQVFQKQQEKKERASAHICDLIYN